MNRITRCTFVFFCCVLAIPTCVYAFGILRASELQAAVAAGTLLGCAHVLLRPLLRFVTWPLGCVTFGLSGFAIDTGLIYACDYLRDGFAVPGLWQAALSALLVNAACLIVGGRR